MDEYSTGAWEEFEAWIRTTIGGDFRGNIRPRDNIANREMVAELTSDEILVGQRHFGHKGRVSSNPKRERGNCRNVFPRLRFGLQCDAKVALSN